MVKRFLGDTIVYGVARSLPPIGSFLLLPVYTSFLNPAEFGIVALFEVEATILTNLMMVGIDQVIPRYFSEDRAGEVDLFISSGLYFCLVSAAIFLCVVSLLAFPVLDGLLRHQAISEYRPLVLLVAVQSAAAVPVCFAEVILRMQGRAVATNLVGLGLFALRSTVAVVLLVATAYRVEALVLGNVVASVAVGGCCLFLMRHYLAAAPRWRQLKEVGYHAAFMWTNVLVSTAGQTADRILLAALTSARSLGNYAVAHKVASSIHFTGATWSYVFQPYFFRKGAGEDPKLIRLIGVAVAFLAAMAIVVIALRDPLIAFFARGADFTEAAKYVPLLLIAFWLKFVWSFLSQELVKASRTPLVLLISAAGTGCLVLSLILLVPVIGVFGAATALVIHRLVSVGLAYFVVRRGVSDIPWSTVVPCLAALGVVSWASLTGMEEVVIEAAGFAVTMGLLAYQALAILSFADIRTSWTKLAFWKSS